MTDDSGRVISRPRVDAVLMSPANNGGDITTENTEGAEKTAEGRHPQMARIARMARISLRGPLVAKKTRQVAALHVNEPIRVMGVFKSA